MHPIGLSTGSRSLGSLAVVTAMIIVIAVCRRHIRRHSTPGLYKVLGAYNLMVLATFLFGLLRDDGYGWAFLPVLALTVPWSLFIPVIIAAIPGGWFPASPSGGVLMNFVIFVGLCGGLNNVLLFLLIRRVFYRRETEAHRLL